MKYENLLAIIFICSIIAFLIYVLNWFFNFIDLMGLLKVIFSALKPI